MKTALLQCRHLKQKDSKRYSLEMLLSPTSALWLLGFLQARPTYFSGETLALKIKWNDILSQDAEFCAHYQLQCFFSAITEIYLDTYMSGWPALHQGHSHVGWMQAVNTKSRAGKQRSSTLRLVYVLSYPISGSLSSCPLSHNFKVLDGLLF